MFDEMVRVVSISPTTFSLSVILEAADVVLSGGLVVYPTDTVYGLGANPLDVKAVKKALLAKKRVGKPMPVLVSSIKAAEILVYVNSLALKLMQFFWPGPLTIVLPKKPYVPNEVTAGMFSLGVRMPNHLVAIKLADFCGGFILGTSANVSGRKSPKTAGEALRQLGDAVDLIIDAGRCPIGVPSTVIDLTGSTPIIVREGAVRAEEIENVIGVKVVKKRG
ncbi:MAG: threonylcarbamoyl-AMP synthase [Candidatus Methanomethylicota archaeon]|uniref:L-threonylcarbamoyladenylate synthase n=1 Tax=Thermoproteota archaeon TaxID=2056631 RepID=A0A497F688_9CREN|nr:MAG: threonylcarbamoyl-AMP synthase [Candidatus Verstraetearchaeota archaeon]